nr:ATPase, F1/V1/A1 complex, alpha/beta subunit, zinc knuckle CX2CX4HX4C [Tanacetum cinerariifolium]
MEVGFILGNNVSKKNGLASKIKNINGKLLGKDGKPLKVVHKGAGVKTNRAIPDGTTSVESTGPGNIAMSKEVKTTDTCVNAGVVVENLCMASKNMNDPGPNVLLGLGKTGLSLITTQLGQPIRLDACTSDMCLNPWGRNSYARFLVELSSKCVVMKSIVVAIPLPKGEGHYLETLNVEYEWWPPRCSKCKIFDHEDDYYPVKVKKANSDPSSGTWSE